MPRPISFDEAKRRYVHRFTVEHVPSWARAAMPNGRFPAPQYLSDAQWYNCTSFPGENGISPRACHCESTGQTWPFGQFLAAPFKRKVMA